MGDVFAEAIRLLIAGETQLWEVVGLSIWVTGLALLISAAIGFPLGALLGAARFPGRAPLRLLFTTLMGLPPVVVGLTLYMLLSASGPLGVLGLLYTPWAMVLAQCVLILPIVVALTADQVEALFAEYQEQFTSMGVGRFTRLTALLLDARHSLATVALAGFGRAIAEVGAVMIVGGNINHVTRVMTTSIALETSRGNLTLALALGVVLLGIALLVNGTVALLQSRTREVAYG